MASDEQRRGGPNDYLPDDEAVFEETPRAREGEFIDLEVEEDPLQSVPVSGTEEAFQEDIDADVSRACIRQ